MPDTIYQLLSGPELIFILEAFDPLVVFLKQLLQLLSGIPVELFVRAA